MDKQIDDVKRAIEECNEDVIVPIVIFQEDLARITTLRVSEKLDGNNAFRRPLLKAGQ